MPLSQHHTSHTISMTLNELRQARLESLIKTATCLPSNQRRTLNRTEFTHAVRSRYSALLLSLENGVGLDFQKIIHPYIDSNNNSDLLQLDMPKLPPRVGKVNSENFLNFVPMEGVDFTFAGYLLACHLAIEHYLDEFLKSRAPELNWNNGKLNFAQKAALFPHTMFPQGEQAIAGIRHINVLRNKLAHRLDAKPDDFDYLPFVRFLEQDLPRNADPIPTTPMELLEAFTGKLSYFFMGWLASDAYRTTWRQNVNK